MPSTTERGDAFEDTCYNVILDALRNNKLSVLPEHAVVYRKKSYWSKLREDNIVFDLSIELMPPGAERPVSIWFIECKDYTGSVPVNDIEEFRQKVMQVADLNCKAVIMTTGQLQSGARTTARNSGCKLPQDQVRGIVETHNQPELWDNEEEQMDGSADRRDAARA